MAVNPWTWLKSLFARTTGQRRPQKRIPWPTKEEIFLLPPFEGLTLKDIVVVASAAAADRAYKELIGAGVVGFDTESKPTFFKGQVSTGPHVIQFSTTKRAYIFQLQDEASSTAAAKLMEAPQLKKVGFGLIDDLRRIRKKMNVEPKSTVDLETMYAARGYGNGVGVKVGIAILFKKRFFKSKKASTSNWMNRQLNPKQLLYAANDAYAAIRAYNAFQ